MALLGDDFKIENIDDLNKIKDILFQKEKGEALAKASTPRTSKEDQSTGFFDGKVNMIGNGAIGVATAQNFFANDNCGFIIDFVYSVFRSSASKQARRLENIKEM